MFTPLNKNNNKLRIGFLSEKQFNLKSTSLRICYFIY
jgi:hypothetical protein